MAKGTASAPRKRPTGVKGCPTQAFTAPAESHPQKATIIRWPRADLKSTYRSKGHMHQFPRPHLLSLALLTATLAGPGCVVDDPQDPRTGRGDARCRGQRPGRGRRRRRTGRTRARHGWHRRRGRNRRSRRQRRIGRRAPGCSATRRPPRGRRALGRPPAGFRQLAGARSRKRRAHAHAHAHASRQRRRALQLLLHQPRGHAPAVQEPERLRRQPQLRRADSGLDGADKICQTIAEGEGFGGKTWRAFLSVVQGPEGSRSTPSTASARVPGTTATAG